MPLTLREKMILSLLPVAVGTGMIGTGTEMREAPIPAAVYVTPSPATSYPDCGDAEAPPCVTWDDGAQGDGWYLVTGDGASLLPVRPVATTDPVTRDFWYELS